MSTLDDRSLVQRLNSRRPLLWLNPHLAPAKTVSLILLSATR